MRWIGNQNIVGCAIDFDVKTSKGRKDVNSLEVELNCM